MQQRPTPLSVVIPTHDTRELTLRCLESLRSAAPHPLAPSPIPSPPPGEGEGNPSPTSGGPDRRAWEVILVDDASRDGTLEAVAAAHPEVVLLRHEEALGFSRAANRGLAAARGEILLLLNSDTEVDRPGMEALLAAFAAEPRLGGAGAALHYPDGSPQWSGGAAPSLAWLFALASGLPALLGRLPAYRRLRPPGAPARHVEWVTGAALAIRRRAWEEVGPLDEEFRFYGQDLDYCLRLRRAGWSVELLPEFSVLHHHGATIGRDPDAPRGQHPELLWTDLLHWARKHRGERWAGRAALLMRLGATLRLLGRAPAGLLLPPARRAAWRAESEAFSRARQALYSPR